MDWEKISLMIPGRNNVNCKNRWGRTQQEKITKLIWNEDEDSTLKNILKETITMNWDDIAAKFNKCFPGRERTKTQCRIRWTNFLDPRINK